jgi:uncharacterized membrane protein YeiB
VNDSGFQQKKKGHGIVIFSMLAVLVVLFVVANLIKTPLPAVSNQEAYDQAKQFVSAKLVAPATADFALKYIVTTNDARTNFTIQAYVDSQNNFGAKTRKNFLVQMKFEAKSRTWTLIDLRWL